MTDAACSARTLFVLLISAIGLPVLPAVAAGVQSQTTPVFSSYRVNEVLNSADQAARTSEGERLLQLLGGTRQFRQVSIIQDAHIDRTVADIEELRRKTARIQDRFDRLVNEAREGRSHGLIGMISEFSLNALGSLVGTPEVLNVAVSAGVRTGIETGSIEQAVFAAGLAAGVASTIHEAVDAFSKGMIPGPEESTFLRDLVRRPTADELKSRLVADFVTRIGTEVENAFTRGHQPPPMAAPGQLDVLGTIRTAVDEYLDEYLSVTDSAGDAGSWGPARSVLEAGVPRGVSPAGKTGAGKRPASHTAPIFTPVRIAEIDAVADAVGRENSQERWLYHLYERRIASRDILGRQGKLDYLLAVLAADIDTHNALVKEYNRILADLESQGGGGFFGSICRLVVGTMGTALGGPLVGAALAGGLGVAMNRGKATEVLAAAAWSAGRAGTRIAVSNAVQALLHDDSKDSNVELTNQAPTLAPGGHHTLPLAREEVPTPLLSRVATRTPSVTGPSIEQNDAIHGGAHEARRAAQDRARVELYDIPIQRAYPEFWLIGGGAARKGSGWVVKNKNEIAFWTLCLLTTSKPADYSKGSRPRPRIESSVSGSRKCKRR